MNGERRAFVVVPATALLVVFVGLGGYARLTATGVDRPTPSPTAVQIPARDKHDIAVLSVDFDPPLGTPGRRSKDSALLVAVDNRGTETGKDLVLVVRLAAEDLAEVTARFEEPVGKLAPGEVKVVRLTGLADVPLRSSRWLTVQVEPIQGETNVANNSKTLRIDALAALDGS